MDLGVEVSRLRCATVWAGVTGAAVCLAGLLLPVLGQATTAARSGGLAAAGFESVLVWGCAWVALTVTAWLWVVATVVTVDAARGTYQVRRGVPVALRSALLALCGVALTSGIAGPALASGDRPAGPQLLTGLRLPERMAVEPTNSAPIAAPQATDAVVVAPGDTLWAITADWLGPGASDDEVAASWPRVYALNRDRIGPDSGLIEPGQRLLLPPVHDGATR